MKHIADSLKALGAEAVSDKTNFSARMSHGSFKKVNIIIALLANAHAIDENLHNNFLAIMRAMKVKLVWISHLLFSDIFSCFFLP